MDHMEFHLKCLEVIDNEEELMKLYIQQAKDQNNPYYLYTLFGIFNKNFIDLNPKTINYINILEETIKFEKQNGYILGDRSFYELDFKFLCLLSEIDVNASNLFASLIAPARNYIYPDDYAKALDLDKFKTVEFDPEYIVYRAYYGSINPKVNYVYRKLCLYVLGEKNFEKYVQKPLLKSKYEYHKDYRKLSDLSTYERTVLLDIASSMMHNEIRKKRSQ